MKYNFQIDMEANNSHTMILKKIKPQSKVLEFGPATGYMSQYMKEFLNCTIHAIEVDFEAAKIAEVFTEKMIVCDVDTLEWVSQIQSQEYDYIVFADVLEHLKNPWQVLKEVAKFLKPSGQLLISIPNIAHNAVLIDLLNGRFQYRKLGLLDNTHLRFFTRESVIDLVESSGLYISNIQEVLIAPEITELEVNYQSIPHDVASFLKSRKDGDVYQYVVTATKISIDKGHSKDLFPEIYVVSDYVEIFLDDGQGFNSQNSFKLPIKKINETQQFNFSFEKTENVKAIRIDPANSVGIGIIKEITLINLETNEKEDILNQIQPVFGVNILQSEEEHFTFLSYSNDPQLIYYMSTEKKISNLNLNITLSFSKVYDQNQAKILNEFIVKQDLQITNMNNEHREEVQFLIKSNEELRSQIQTIELQNKELMKHIQLIDMANDALNNQVTHLKGENKKLCKKNDQLYKDYESILNSRSWKITEPLRKMKNLLSLGRGKF